MNREEAEEILLAYRPGGRDEDESLFGEALEHARRDPQLMAWLKEQMKLDTAVRRKLMSSTVPPDLVAQIHAGVALRRKGRRQQHLALAACLALLAVLAGLWFGRPKPSEATMFAAYRKEMADFLKQFPRLDVETERVSEMRQWLAEQHALASIEIPAGLEKFPGIGCRTVQWRGKKLALICFMVDGEVVHLFVLPRSQFPDAPPGPTPQFAKMGQMTTACWQKGEVTYVALTKGGEAFLRKCL